MEEKYKVGDTGLMEFIYRGGKTKNWMKIVGEIVETEPYWILFRDNHSQFYQVQKRDIKNFKIFAINILSDSK